MSNVKAEGESDRDFKIHQRGRAGEDYVCDSLREKGFSVTARNFRFRGGEIDIIAENEKLIIFVEVKTRTKRSMTGGFESVTFSKQQKLRKTAMYYIMKNPSPKQPRFDCAEVIVDPRTNAMIAVSYIENAFS